MPKTAGRLGPIREADALGIDVCTAGMDSGVSGTLEKERGSDPTIYLNRTRQREPTAVTCAHELGHYVRRTSNGDMNDEFVEAPAQLAGTDPTYRHDLDR